MVEVEVETDYAEVEQQADDNKRGKSAADDNKQRVCPECGAKFVPRDGRRLYCSEKCARRRQRRQCRENKRVRNRKLKLSPRQKMKINLARRDALAPKPKIEIIERNGIVIERRGTVPLGCHAVGIIKHT